MQGIYFETAHNIQIRQRPASLGNRILAQVIDSFILVVYFIMVSFTAYGIVEMEGNSIALITVLILPFLVYHLLFELFMNGQSIGKYLVNIRVVQLDGSKASISSYLIRWLLRPVDITICSGGIAILSILLGGKGQRLGDIAAGTTVVSLNESTVRREDLLLAVAENHEPKYPQVVNLTDAQLIQIKKIRMEALKSHDFILIRMLAEKTGKLLQITYTNKPLEFVDQVILDYEYFAQRGHGEGIIASTKKV